MPGSSPAGGKFRAGALLSGRLPAAAADKAAAGSAAVASTASPPAPKLHATPGAPRGRLKNGNPPVIIEITAAAAPHAGGCCCRQPAMPTDAAGCMAASAPAAHARGPRALPHYPACPWLPHPRPHRSSAPAAHAPAASAPSRASCPPASPLGWVHRSVSISPYVGAAQRGRLRPQTINPRQGATLGAPLRKEPLATAGHGLHRSFRVICFIGVLCGSPTFLPNGELPLGMGSIAPIRAA